MAACCPSGPNWGLVVLLQDQSDQISTFIDGRPVNATDLVAMFLL